MAPPPVKTLLDQILELKAYRKELNEPAIWPDDAIWLKFRRKQLAFVDRQLQAYKISLNALYNNRPLPMPEGLNMSDVLTEGDSAQAQPIDNSTAKMTLEQLRAAFMVQAQEQEEPLPDLLASLSKDGKNPDKPLPVPEAKPQLTGTIPCSKSSHQTPTALPELPPSSPLAR